MTALTKGLCWLRRDLRLHDHAALSHCLQENDLTYLVFVFDQNILAPLQKKDAQDKRMQFIAESLFEMQQTLRNYQSSLIVVYGDPVIEIPALIKKLEIDHLYFNRDYSPYAMQRDRQVSEKLNALDVKVSSYQDHVIFEPQIIVNQSGSPYRVFTPYQKAWLSRLGVVDALPTFPVNLTKLATIRPSDELASLQALLTFSGFSASGADLIFPGGSQIGLKRLENFENRIEHYQETRDYLTADATSQLSVYLRHGCISIRDMVNVALRHRVIDVNNIGADKWLSELIWREFYQMIIYFYPAVHQQAFQEKFRSLVWPGSEDLLSAFKQGKTGFPIIDAAMRCLNQTGWMPNRLRMITASFLTKILLVDWRRGERYFAWKLLDYELASNNGGWQWSAGVGCDAAPYFRIFNPVTQSQQYDPQGDFIGEYCPELKDLNQKDIHWPMKAKQLPANFKLGRDYPHPIVDYALQRQAALAFYKTAS